MTTRREFLTPTNIAEQPDHSGIVLPDPNFGIDAQIQSASRQAEMLSSAADFMDANPQMSRRGLFTVALYGAGKTVEAQQGFKNTVEYLGYPQHLIDTLGPFWYNPLEAENRHYNNILFSGNIPVFNNHGLGHSCLVEDAYGRPMLAAGSHVMEMAIENGGSMYSYIPWAGFYEWKLDYLYKTKTYANDRGDYGIWFLPLEGVAKQNVNWLVQRDRLRILRFVNFQRARSQSEYTMSYRPDVDKLVYLKSSNTDRQVISEVLNEKGEYEDPAMNVFCGGNSGSGLFEVNQENYMPTGRLIGVATAIGEGDPDTYGNLAGCDNLVRHRGLPHNEDGYIETVYVK